MSGPEPWPSPRPWPWPWPWPWRQPPANVGIHYRGVQWEGGAVDGGSII